jgi:hypothetical protein
MQLHRGQRVKPGRYVKIGKLLIPMTGVLEEQARIKAKLARRQARLELANFKKDNPYLRVNSVWAQILKARKETQ